MRWKDLKEEEIDGDGDGPEMDRDKRLKTKRSLEEEWNPPLWDLLTRDVRCVGGNQNITGRYRYSAVTAGRYNVGGVAVLYRAVPCICGALIASRWRILQCIRVH